MISSEPDPGVVELDELVDAYHECTAELRKLRDRMIELMDKTREYNDKQAKKGAPP